MATCPNTNTKEWKDLVKSEGENKSHFLWSLREETPSKDLIPAEKSKQLQKEFDKKLHEKLIKVARGLKVNVVKNDEFYLNKGPFKNTLSAFDTLQKFLVLGKDITNKDLALQTANIIYTFLGRKSKISSDLWFHIDKWEGYEKVYNSYSNVKGDPIIEDVTEREFGRDKQNFNSFAHRQAILYFIAQELVDGVDNNAFVLNKKTENVDIDQAYFRKRGFLNDVYENNPLKKVLKQFWNFISKNVFGNTKFDIQTSETLKETMMEVVDDVYKNDFTKFFRVYAENENLEVVDRKGVKYEQKDYDKTWDSDPFAFSVFKGLSENPFVNFKLSGSQVLRKFGKLMRSVDEDLHDIDGVIPVETFREDPGSVDFYLWLKTRGLELRGDNKQFMKEFKPRLEKLNWYVNVKNMYPDFVLDAAFIGKDHKNAESVTITGHILHPVNKDEKGKPKKLVLDFFLRTHEGNYPEIFEHYFKDWKQIMEAKLNMGRAKDLNDLLFFVPFKKDLNKFTNKSFRYFTFAGHNEIDIVPSTTQTSLSSQKDEMTFKNFVLNQKSSVLLQAEGTEGSVASPESLTKIKQAAKKMGIKINTLTNYAKEHPDVDITNVNALADLVTKTVAVAEGLESVGLTEEIVHIATAMVEQTTPNLITTLLKRINKYQIYQDTLNQYKNNIYYQDSSGKPDIRKIKKEALDKLLVEVIINQSNGDISYPELADRENVSWLREVWEYILSAIRQLYKKSDIDILNELATNISEGAIENNKNPLTGGIFFNINENKAVNTAIEDIKAISARMVLHPATKNKKRHYTLDGVEIAQSVTEKLRKNKDTPIADATDKMFWGSEGHAYLEKYILENLIDKETGYKKEKFTNTRIKSALQKDVKAAIQIFADDLISSYPKGTKFLTEYMAVNQNVKGGLASTIDFTAFIPTKDKNGEDSVKVHVLDWKFTSFNANRYEDLSPGKQTEWKKQMNEYVIMLTQKAYPLKRDQIEHARMIPFIATYKDNIPGVPEEGEYITEIEVSNVTDIKESKLYLLPVPVDSESTGNPRIDQLIKALEIQASKMFKKFGNVEETFKKKAESIAISSAIKKLRLQLDFEPLISVGKTIRDKVSYNLEQYEDIDWNSFDKIQIEAKLADLLEYEQSLEKFVDLREIYAQYLDDGVENTPEEDLVKRQLERISLDAESLTNQIQEYQRDWVKVNAVNNKVILDENIDDLLKAEKKVTKLSYSFLEGSRLHPRIIRLASKLILKATKLIDIVVNRKITKYNKLVLELEKEASARGVKAFDLIGEVKENDLRLISKINPDFWEAREKAIKNKNKKFFKDNMNLTTYKAQVSKILKEQYAQLDRTVIYMNDPAENARAIKFKKDNLKKTIDIFDEGFFGFNQKFFYKLFLENFKEEKHYSERYLELKSNKAAHDVWQFFTDLNKDARDLGYLTDQKSSFFPLMEATMLQKLGQTKSIPGQSRDFFMDAFTSRIDENKDYIKRDPETGEIIKEIPKYFIKTDKNVEQLSRDLNQVGATWINSIERYRNSRELENVLLTLHKIEGAKDHIVSETGEIVIKKGNEENTGILEKIIDDFLYGIKESETSLGNVQINKLAESRYENDEEKREEFSVNTKKTIQSANTLIEMLALGLKPMLGIANYIGTQLQSFIKSGEFYTFTEYQKNHAKVMFSNFGSLGIKQKALLDFFVVLNEDTALESRRRGALKEGYLKYLSTWSFTDTMMLTMGFPEKKLQLANGLSFIDNGMVIDGEIVNIRQYLKEQDRTKRKDENLSFTERKELQESFESRVTALKKSSNLATIVDVSEDGVTIPGVTDESVADYRTKMIDYNRSLNGMMDHDDKMGYRRDTMFSSFMMFKSWIPKLVYVRAQKIDKNELTDNWEYGRMRGFTKALMYVDNSSLSVEQLQSRTAITRISQFASSAINNITQIVKGTDEGMQIINAILADKKAAHFKRTGQQLEITEEEFQDLMRKIISDQFKELLVLFTVMGVWISAAVAEPPEDATKLERNQYKAWMKQINKITEEITFYYNPGSTEAILQGTFIPAVGLLAKAGRFISQLGREVYGESTGDAEMVKKAHPSKYFFNLFPVLSQWQNEVLPYTNPEWAKERGIIVTEESRK